MKNIATVFAGTIALIVGWIYGSAGLDGRKPPLAGHVHSGEKPYAWTLGVIAAGVVVAAIAAGARPSWYVTTKESLRIGGAFVALAVAVGSLSWAVGSILDGHHGAGQLVALVVGVCAVGASAGLSRFGTRIGVGVLVLLAAVGVIALLVSTNWQSRSTGVLITRWWAAGVAAAIVVIVVALIEVVVSVGQGAPRRIKAKPTESALVDGKLRAVVPEEQAAAYRRRGLRAVYIGVDGRVSTSKLQVVLWTLLVLFMLIDIWLQNRCFGGACEAERAINRHPVIDIGHLTLQPAYWAVLAIPAGAAAYAMALMKGSTVEKTAITAAEQDGGILRGLRETVSDDTGGVDLGDTQYFLFNLIGLSYVLVTFLQHPYEGLPDIPATLVGLMGVSAATYGAKKGTSAADKPSIKSLTPSEVIVGVDRYIEIEGAEFILPGVQQATSLNDVVIGGRSCRALETQPGTIVTNTSSLTWYKDRVVVDLSLFGSNAEAAAAILRSGLTLTGGRCQTTVTVRDNRGVSSASTRITIRPRS